MDAAGWLIDSARDLDIPIGLEEGQPDPMLDLSAIARESPGDHSALDPGTWTQEAPARVGEPELRRFYSHLKPGQWQCAQVVVEQPGAIAKAVVSIRDKPIEAGAIIRPCCFEERINCRSD